MRALAPLLALILAPSGCTEAQDPVLGAEAREGESTDPYAWSWVESIGYDHVGGINPCVHVGAEILEYADIDELVMHTSVSYEDPETGQMLLEIFDVSLSEALIVEHDDELAIELGPLQLGAAPSEETLAVTAELTTTSAELPDFWWAEVLAVDLNAEWGIVPCVHVTHAAYATASHNEISMTLDVSYEDVSGVVFMEQFSVPLSSARIMDVSGAMVDVQSPPLSLAGEADESTVVVQASLAWP